MLEEAHSLIVKQKRAIQESNDYINILNTRIDKINKLLND